MIDVHKIRKDFPILRREVNGKPLVYLDNAATTQKPLKGQSMSAEHRTGSSWQNPRASSLSSVERETVQIAASVERRSEYCVAGHTRFARDQQVDEGGVGSLRSVEPVADARLDALARFTRALVRGDGHVDPEDVKRFHAAGYTSAQALEVILGICVKTMSNLTSNTFGIPLDEAFASCVWEAPL